MAFNIGLPYELEQYVNPDPVETIGGVSIQVAARPDATIGRIMNITAGSGFGFVNALTSAPWMMTIDDKIDYEISFWFSQSEITPSFSLSMNSFNCSFTQYQTYDITTGNAESFFIKSTEQVIPYSPVNARTWRFARYIVYNKNRPIQPTLQPKTSLAVGRNLKFNPSVTTSKMMVNLKCTFDQIQIWNFKVKPLSTPFSTGFVQGTDLLEIWRKNNNKRKKETDIDNIANKILLPYNNSNVSIKL